MNEVRIALVGIAGYGEHYLKGLLGPSGPSEGRLEGCRLVAAVDTNPERCSRLAELRAAGIPVFSDLASIYANPGSDGLRGADLVIIAAPIHLHAALTIEALGFGSNVLCEKPLCASTEDAKRMAAAEAASGKFVAVGYQWSFSPPILDLKNDILAGIYGAPRRFKTLVLWPRKKSYFKRNTWAGKLRTPDGRPIFDSPLNNAMAHYLHNMLFLLGGTSDTAAEAGAVRAELFRANEIENFDTAAFSTTASNGASSGVELRMYAAHPVRDFFGPLVRFEFDGGIVESGADGVIVGRRPDGREKTYGNPDDHQYAKVAACVRAVRGASPIVCGIAAATPQVRCIERVQECPISDFSAERLRIADADGDPLVWVEGLREDFFSRFNRSDS